MNVIQESMKEIQASEELKAHTLQYLKTQKRYPRPYRMWRYAAAAACLLLFLAAGGYRFYSRPVSYISIDVNPSIELGVNRFGRVVSADAYNTDGQNILDHVKLRNLAYVQAIDKLIKSDDYAVFLTEDSHLVFTVISDNSDVILKEINADALAQKYQVTTYTSDLACRQEAHQHEMSFGKYRACQELAQYDESVTIEDCHGMTMGEICDSIRSCQRYRHGREKQDDAENNGSGQGDGQCGGNAGHHGRHHRNRHGGGY